MTRTRKPDVRSPDAPVSVHFRVSKPMLDAIDALATETGMSRAAALDELLAAGLGKVDVKALSEKVRAGRKAVMALKADLLKTLRDRLEELERE